MKYGTSGGTVRIRAANACGVSSYKSLAVAITCRESLSETENEMEAFIYPNPSKNFFSININSSTHENYNLVVRDMIGRVVAQWNKLESSQPFDFGNELSNGIYFAEVINGDARKILRMVKSE